MNSSSNIFDSIRIFPGKKFIGKRLTMSFQNNKTFELWHSFMPQKHLVKNTVGTDLYSLQFYPQIFFNPFNPSAEFEKFALMEVSEINTIPEGMQSLEIPKGKYAVFIHRGMHTEAAKTFGYIFTEWLPNSGYKLDNRAHFEILGDKYKRDNPDSEEEVWIPIN